MFQLSKNINLIKTQESQFSRRQRVINSTETVKKFPLLTRDKGFYFKTIIWKKYQPTVWNISSRTTNLQQRNLSSRTKPKSVSLMSSSSLQLPLDMKTKGLFSTGKVRLTIQLETISAESMNASISLMLKFSMITSDSSVTFQSFRLYTVRRSKNGK